MRGLVIAALLAALSSYSGLVRSESYLVVDVGAPGSDPVPTFLGLETPRFDWRSRATPESSHLALDEPLTMIRLGAGRYNLSHFHFTEALECGEMAYFRDGWKIHIFRNAVHYLGPKSFVGAEPNRTEIVRTLEQLCASFPLEMSGLHEFRFLRYEEASSPVRYTCKPGAEVDEGESPN